MAAKVRILYHPPEQCIGGREARQLAATQSTVVQIHSDTPNIVNVDEKMGVGYILDTITVFFASSGSLRILLVFEARCATTYYLLK